jgi:tetraprenyl-beta-curcumene synthase
VRERLALASVFTGAALRYWLTVFPRVSRELRRLRRRARAIPDPALRRLALEALGKRGNIEGAAAFAAFAPWRRRRATVRALVAFQSAYNYADALAEQPSADPVRNAYRLHDALRVALDPAAVQLDFRERRHQHGDGGYLAETLDTCRRALRALPSYPALAPAAERAAARIVAFQSLSLASRRGERCALERWARAATPAAAAATPAASAPESGLLWWETAAAAGSSLAVHALIAAAAERAFDPRELAALEGAYFPWIGALHSLLDSLVDRREDADTGQFSLIGCYRSREDAAVRMAAIAAQAAHAARRLPRGRRHLVLFAGMAGSYLYAARDAQPARASAPDACGIVAGVLPAMGGLARPTLLVFAARDMAGRLLRATRRVRPGANAADDAPGAAAGASAGLA